ncbi:MAG: acyl-CoA dehydrogenase, partial [Gammaproteobacteria bacterium]|nr:acyl-CoA dehydrogenase [Gammaproteobacteria bacterium]
MFQGMNFAPAQLPGELEALRAEVREFLNAETDWHPNSDFNAGASPEFSKRFAAKGWIGMTWPKEYGGGGRSFLERYVVTEELLAAGAPVGCHWIADRQSGPLLLKFGTEAQKQAFLPGIISGESFYSIGMSEPDTGSDLASIRTSAVQVPGGWCLNGSKIWTSNAHLNHFMVTLVRTAPATENRHEGMSQFIVPIHADGVTVRGIDNLAGEQDFNQIFFDDVFVPDDHVVGEAGNGWAQVMSELAYERSGPERFLSAFRVLAEFGKSLQNDATESQARLYGQLVSHLVVLRRMSISIASLLENGLMPDTEAALIKDLGNSYERLVPEVVRLYLPGQVPKGLAQALEECVLHAPSFT